ncbi:hypothetical protein [Synechococcus sp. MU1611]|uniref:hypothetical protein n=1 Tax=Synechococcus sp. MU1611 TaxID=2508345 RepID=UPI001CF9258D|nr:hypothetical protein [Synechococcus sp. MU1611]
MARFLFWLDADVQINHNGGITALLIAMALFFHQRDLEVQNKRARGTRVAVDP